MTIKTDIFIPIRKGNITRYYKNDFNESFVPQPVYISHRESFDWFVTKELAIIVDRAYKRALTKFPLKIPVVKILNISFKPVGTPNECIKLHKTYVANINITFETKDGQITDTITGKDYEFPFLTPSCTFVIYGKEKIFINQIRKNSNKTDLVQNLTEDSILTEGDISESDESSLHDTDFDDDIEDESLIDPYDEEHLKNKHVVTIGNVLAKNFEEALDYFYNVISKSKHKDLTQDNIQELRKIFIRCLASKLYYLYHKNDYLQPLERLNPLSIASQFNMLTHMGKGGLSAKAGLQPRDVNNSYFCRLCPIETPEGKNCGLIHHLSSYAKIQVWSGVIETPYIRIADQKPYWFAPESEEQLIISEVNADMSESETVLARQGRTIKKFPITDILYKEVATDQMLGTSASLIPFIEHDDGHRALMAASMQKQAVPLLYPEPPIIGTGREYQIADDISSLNLLNTELSIKDGELALGKNVLVAYMPWYGYNYEDGIVISQELVDKDILTSIHKSELSCTLANDEPDSQPERFTSDIPNITTTNLDENGIIKLGSNVKPGDILIGKLSPSPFASTPVSNSIFGGEEFKDSSLYADDDTYGKVTTIRYLDSNNSETNSFSEAKTIIINIEQRRKITLGDKLSGRHGNKGVVSRILPKEEMPYVIRNDGSKEHIQILLNPLGVPSRMNIGQLFETHLGWIARELGTKIANQEINLSLLKPYFQGEILPETAVFGINKYIAVPFAVPAFNSPSLKTIQQLYRCLGLDESCKSTVYNPVTDKPYPNSITVGIAYMLKLDHLVDDKIHVRSSGRYTQLTEQPLQGRSNDGGQRLGEMEVWALEAHGAVNNLSECLTTKSDDIHGRETAELALRKGTRINNHNLPESFKYLIRNLKALGFEIEIRNKERQLMTIDEISPTIK